MIKLHFYDYGCGVLDVEGELGITEEAYDFLIKNIPGLSLDCTDCAYDTEDNDIYWFTADNEEDCLNKIEALIKKHIRDGSNMKYKISITSEYSWYD